MRIKPVFIVLALVGLVGVAVYQNFFAVSGQADETASLQAQAGDDAISDWFMSSQNKTPKPGEKAPSFSLTGLDQALHRAGGRQEKAQLINFWASWCDPCEAEAPELAKMYEKYKDQLDIYSVNVTLLDLKDDAAAFVRKHQYSFPVLMDAKGDAMDLYKVNAYPTNFFVDRDGVIQDVLIGYKQPGELEQKIRLLLKQAN